MGSGNISEYRFPFAVRECGPLHLEANLYTHQVHLQQLYSLVYNGIHSFRLGSRAGLGLG